MSRPNAPAHSSKLPAGLAERDLSTRGEFQRLPRSSNRAGKIASFVDDPPQGRKETSGKVLSLNREGTQASVRVESEVIKRLEDFLNEARCGETIAGAIVLVRPNATICSAISAPRSGRQHLVAACDYLKQDIIAETDN